MSDLLQPYILDPFEGEGKLIDNIEGAPVYYLAFSRLGLMEYDLTYCDGCANTPALRASIQEGR
ncbi:MAG TPA: hypothetical protein VNV63_01605, partial [Nitrospiria bacterium]|nr:hypothetical protein [Nitrospiria bacterium]